MPVKQQVKGDNGYVFTRAGDGCGWVQPIQTQTSTLWLSIVCREYSYGGDTGLFEVGLKLAPEGEFVPQGHDFVLGWVTWSEMAAIIHHLQGTSLEAIRAKLESKGHYDLRQAAGLEE